MLAVRSPSGASTIVVFAIAMGASLAMCSTPRELAIAHPMPPLVIEDPGRAFHLDDPSSAIDIDEPSLAIEIDEPAADCGGTTYEFVPYIHRPAVEPPRTREEAIERARPHGTLGILVRRPCRGSDVDPAYDR